MLMAVGSSRSFRYRIVAIGRGTERLVPAKPEGTETAFAKPRSEAIESIKYNRSPLRETLNKFSPYPPCLCVH